MFSKQNMSAMKRPMKIMLISLAVLFGAIFIYKGIVGLMIKQYFAEHSNPVITVSTAKVNYVSWQPQLKAVASLRTTLGVNVTAQLGGMIQTIYFTPGTTVTAGTRLVQQNADPDIAQLHALEATEELDRITYERDKAQYKVHAVSKQQLDTDLQNLKNASAQVAQQQATVVKLTIVAPFTGRLGISKVNPGQYLNPGDTVVTLQKLDPIYVDFNLPQQALAQLKLNADVSFTTDSYPGQIYTGKITTINPIVDENTRNVEVEATLPNPKGELLPGMFGNVDVSAGAAKPYLTVSQTAISFNPYGELAYIVKEKSTDKKGKKTLFVTQVFVETGETRGDQVTVIKGLKAGDIVVTSGQLKLKNGSLVAINNSVQPSDSANPTVTDDHGENS
jgi:membrane fusion protein (multidrug efflux system)